MLLVSQVTYTEILVASLGSIAYAEDEGRHMLGVKAMQSSDLSESVSEGRRELTVQEEATGKFCCHVLECDSEVNIEAVSPL